MFYVVHDSNLLVANSIAELLKQLPSFPAFNERYLGEILCNGFFCSKTNLFETIFKGVYRVPIGYKLELDLQGLPQVTRAWSLRDKSLYSAKSFSQAKNIFKDQLFNAVSDALKKSDIAVELSGGLDSSSVAAVARRLLPRQDIVAITHGVLSEGLSPAMALSAEDKRLYELGCYDETIWSRRAANALDLRRIEITDGFRFDDVLENYTEVLGAPSEVLFPLLNHRSYEICHAAGIKTLLSGFGGDEVVSQHAKLHLQELRLRGAIARYLCERLCTKRKSSKTVWEKPIDHLSYFRIDGIVSQNHHLPLHATVKEREYDFIEGDLSIHWQRRIETSRIIARHFGVDYRFPLTDPTLMGFFHHLPSDYKYRWGTGRYLMRKSMDGLLPKSVIWRNDKAGGTAPAAFSNLIGALPMIFLSRFTPGHRGLLAGYVDIPRLTRRLEAGPVVNSALVRLVVIMIMFAHLEKIKS